MAIRAACKRPGNKKLHYAGLRFLSRQEHLFPHCFGTFSVSSFPFHFVFNENNLKIISTRLPEKWQMLILCSRNTNLALNCLRIQCRDYTERTQGLHMCHHKPRTGHIPDCKTNELQNISRNTNDYYFSSYL